MNKWVELLIGIILLIAPILTVIYLESWRLAAWQFIQGGLVIFVALLGILFILLGISDLKG